MNNNARQIYDLIYRGTLEQDEALDYIAELAPDTNPFEYVQYRSNGQIQEKPLILALLEKKEPEKHTLRYLLKEINQQNFNPITKEQKDEIINLACEHSFSLEVFFKAGYRLEDKIENKLLDNFAKMGSLQNFELLYHYQPEFSFQDKNLIERLEASSVIDDFQAEKDEREQTKIFINTIIRHQKLNSILDNKSKSVIKKL